MASTALALKPNGHLPDKMPADMSPNKAWETITSLWKAVDRTRKEADKAATQAERLGSGIIDLVVATTAGGAVPLLLERWPKYKRLGKGNGFVDTQAVVAALFVVGGGVGAWFGVDGYRYVAEAGKGISASYAGVKGVEIGKKWFANKKK